MIQYILFAILIFLILVTKRRPKKFLDLHRVIGVSSPYVPFIGHVYKYFGTNEDRMKAFDRFGRETYDNKYNMVSLWILNTFIVVVSDPVTASVVLKSCIDKGQIARYARHLLGNGSVFANEEIWRIRRKILKPMFAAKYYNMMVQMFERKSQILMDQIARVAGTGDLSMWRYFSCYSLDSALEMTFGESVNVQKQTFLEALQDYFKVRALLICQPWLCSSYLEPLLRLHARQRRDRDHIWSCVETLIQKKKEAIRTKILQTGMNNPNMSNMKTTSFLELLIELSGGEGGGGGGGGYSATELREESLVLLLAATDTTATAAGFTTVLLANHPRDQHRVYEEIQEVLEYSDRPVCIDDLPKLKYLDAVIKESLRLYPPVPVAIRKCHSEIQLPSGATLPEGCEVLLSFWSMHRNPRLWGADADEFRPERFLSATPDQLASFMPFGHGPRSCIGSRLALAMLKLSVAELTRRWRLRPAAGSRCSAAEPLRVSFEVMLKHVHGFQVQLEQRP
ncbi:cytochrome P450 4d8 [Bicyclus anynana]|uniref:Cytochrome P450 4d8 n=1 Tax=Bicyclus anynana TaxID=110368 RepID=A0ABM3LND9_BICAN|nr:cytochrome P450 4d8 [Bicyclus anynana]